jgi:hypothetical protein
MGMQRKQHRQAATGAGNNHPQLRPQKTLSPDSQELTNINARVSSALIIIPIGWAHVLQVVMLCSSVDVQYGPAATCDQNISALNYALGIIDAAPSSASRCGMQPHAHTEHLTHEHHAGCRHAYKPVNLIESYN